MARVTTTDGEGDGEGGVAPGDESGRSVGNPTASQAGQWSTTLMTRMSNEARMRGCHDGEWWEQPWRENDAKDEEKAREDKMQGQRVSLTRQNRWAFKRSIREPDIMWRKRENCWPHTRQ